MTKDTKLDLMLAFVTNIVPLLTNIKSVDICGVGDDIMKVWTRNENELAKKMLESANVLNIELVFTTSTRF
jgi:hypothetical protein